MFYSRVRSPVLHKYNISDSDIIRWDVYIILTLVLNLIKGTFDLEYHIKMINRSPLKFLVE